MGTIYGPAGGNPKRYGGLPFALRSIGRIGGKVVRIALTITNPADPEKWHNRARAKREPYETAVFLDFKLDDVDDRGLLQRLRDRINVALAEVAREEADHERANRPPPRLPEEPTVPDCVFCRIVRGEIPAKVVYDGPFWFAFHDINPQAPVHVVVIPKKHVPRLTGRYPDGTVRLLLAADMIVPAVATAAGDLRLKDDDYRIVINNGPGAGQQVQHMHAHILGGWNAGWVPPLVPNGS